MARKRSNGDSSDEAIRKAWRSVLASEGTDLAAVTRLKAVLERVGSREPPKPEKDIEKEKIEEARQIMRREYDDSVASYAQDVIHEIRDGDIQDREQLDQRIIEHTDSSYWATYTAASQQALWASSNSDYALEEGLVDLAGDREDRRAGRSRDIPWATLAAWAYYRDIQEELERLGVDLNAPELFERGDMEDEEDDETEETEEGSPEDMCTCAHARSFHTGEDGKCIGTGADLDAEYEVDEDEECACGAFVAGD